MTPIPAIFAPAHPHLRALGVLGRVTLGLLMHGLVRPFAAAAIDRRTGRVRVVAR